MKLVFLTLLLTLGLFSKEITPSEVYMQTIVIEKQVELLLQHYKIEYKSVPMEKRLKIKTVLKPRNVWQKTYEILIKINILRKKHGMATIAPSNLSPVLHKNSDMVYEQTQRILTELEIFKFRNQIKYKEFKKTIYTDKTASDVFDELSYISTMFDILNEEEISISLIFGANMRIYDDITLILQNLEIKNTTIPREKKLDATLEDNYLLTLQMLHKIKQLQIISGISHVDFSNFRQEKISMSDLFTLSQMTIAELQTIKAYMGITTNPPVATTYFTKSLAEVNQIISWNRRKLNLIKSLDIGVKK